MAGKKTTAAPAGGRSATVFDGHKFVPADDPSDKAAPHCDVCGSGRDAFIHSDEALTTGATVVVNAQDTANGNEQAG